MYSTSHDNRSICLRNRNPLPKKKKKEKKEKKRDSYVMIWSTFQLHKAV